MTSGVSNVRPLVEMSATPAASTLHVAALGDSLTTGFSLSSPLTMIWKAHRHLERSWFVDTSGAIESFVKRLGRHAAVVSHQYATVSAKVVEGQRGALTDCLVNARHFSRQVTQVTRLAQFPNLVLIWIGHNNLDWISHHSGVRVLDTAQTAHLTREFATSFEQQLTRLVDAAASSGHRVAIVVFALVNFERFFQARDQALAGGDGRTRNYRRLDDGYRYFASMRPEHRAGMIRLSHAFNASLQKIVGAVRREKFAGSKLQVRYSPALHDADIGSPSMLRDEDAWHPSARGHELLAHCAYDAVADLLPWLIV